MLLLFLDEVGVGTNSWVSIGRLLAVEVVEEQVHLVFDFRLQMVCDTLILLNFKLYLMVVISGCCHESVLRSYFVSLLAQLFLLLIETFYHFLLLILRVIFFSLLFF